MEAQTWSIYHPSELLIFTLLLNSGTEIPVVYTELKISASLVTARAVSITILSHAKEAVSSLSQFTWAFKLKKKIRLSTATSPLNSSAFKADSAGGEEATAIAGQSSPTIKVIAELKTIVLIVFVPIAQDLGYRNKKEQEWGCRSAEHRPCHLHAGSQSYMTEDLCLRLKEDAKWQMQPYFLPCRPLWTWHMSCCLAFLRAPASGIMLSPTASELPDAVVALMAVEEKLKYVTSKCARCQKPKKQNQKSIKFWSPIQFFIQSHPFGDPNHDY